MLGIHGASWHFLTLLRLCLPRQLELSPFPKAYREYLHAVNDKPCTGIGEASPGEYERRGGAPLEKNFGIARNGLLAKKG